MKREEARELALRIAAVWPTPAWTDLMIRQWAEAMEPFDHEMVTENFFELRVSLKFRPSIAEMVGRDDNWEAQTAHEFMKTPEAMHWSGHNPDDFKQGGDDV